MPHYAKVVGGQTGTATAAAHRTPPARAAEIPRTMRAVVKAQAGPGCEVREVPVPEPEEAEVLIRVLATSVCGTDYHIYSWDPWAQSRIHPPLIMGHECAGEVVALGPGVETHQIGDYVSVETHMVCGVCYQCRTGQEHACQFTRILGVDRDGAFAEYVAVPARNAWINDRSLPPEIATLQEPLGNGVHTALAQELTGRTVALVGCGAIGLMTIPVCRMAGVSAVYAVDVSDFRLKLAERMGATEVIDSRRQDPVQRMRELTDDLGVDVLLEFSGHADGLRQGIRALRAGGEAALLGIPARPVELDIGGEVVLKGITLRGITGRRMFDTWYRVKALLGAGLDIRPVITHRMCLEQVEEAMSLMAAGLCGKVVLAP